jgi:predicted MFS family arabinose efflux permease
VRPRFAAYLLAAALADSGYWIYSISTGWLVENRTHSQLWLGLVNGAGTLPYLLFSLAGGVLADRFERRKAIAGGNIAIGLGAGTLALLLAAGALPIGLLAALAFCIGTINALEHPVDRAWLYELIEGKQLGRSISLSSLEWAVARTFGPALGGVAIAGLGIVGGYAAYAFSVIPMTVLALSVRTGTPAAPQEDSTPDARAGAGAAGAVKAQKAAAERLPAAILPFCILIASFTVSVTPYIALLPDVAARDFGLDARGFGLFAACGGVGAIAGGIALSALGEIRSKGRVVALTAFGGAALLAAFASTHDVRLAGALLVAMGAVDTAMYALANTYVQQLASDRLRGRANAVFSLAFIGGAPIGSLALGALAQRAGNGTALLLGGTFAALASAIFWFAAPAARDAA